MRESRKLLSFNGFFFPTHTPDSRNSFESYLATIWHIEKCQVARIGQVKVIMMGGNDNDEAHKYIFGHFYAPSHNS